MRDRSKQKHFALWAEHRINPEDQRRWLDTMAWYIHMENGKPYVVGGDRINGRMVMRYLHRVIMNALIGVEVDHINGDTLDNRRCNLRLCTRAENGRNLQPRMDGSSQFKGVDWEDRRHRWRARIRYNGKRIHLGYFDNEVEAARIYDAAARKYFGDFARLNFEEAA